MPPLPSKKSLNERSQQKQATAEKFTNVLNPASVRARFLRLGKFHVVLSCAIVGLLAFFALVYRADRGSPPAIEQARKMLQINRPRIAIETLAKVDVAEACYLKAVAFNTTGQVEAARKQIAKAVELAPYDTKYQGFQLLLQLPDGKPETVSELIKLYDLGKSSPGIAFFATRAFSLRKPPDIRSTVQSFKLGLTLIDETPEFMFTTLQTAINSLLQPALPGTEEFRKEQIAEAERLIDKLERVAPKDVELLTELLSIAIRGKLAVSAQHLLSRLVELKAKSLEIAEFRIKIELMLGKPEAAVAVARQAITDHPGQSGLNLILAEAASQSKPSPEREKILAELIAQDPDNAELVTKFVSYLMKSKRVGDAVAVVNQALARMSPGKQRAQLLQLAVGLPLEAKDPLLSEQQVQRFRGEFHNPKMREYFDGRVLFLKNDFPGAKLRFQKVCEPPISDAVDRILAAECSTWLQRIAQMEKMNAKPAKSALPPDKK
jgi:Flp pilus assembly protein TadD